MSSVDFRYRYSPRSRSRRNRLRIQIGVGLAAVAAIALAFVFRPGGEATKTVAPTAPSGASKAAVTGPWQVVTAAPVPTIAPTATATPAAPKERVHTVSSGDTLSSIAKQYYGDASRWSKILDANKAILPDANALQVGQKLKIPE